MIEAQLLCWAQGFGDHGFMILTRSKGQNESTTLRPDLRTNMKASALTVTILLGFTQLLKLLLLRKASATVACQARMLRWGTLGDQTVEGRHRSFE